MIRELWINFEMIRNVRMMMMNDNKMDGYKNNDQSSEKYCIYNSEQYSTRTMVWVPLIGMVNHINIDKLKNHKMAR